MKSYQQFFAEMKRRHVFKVAAIYGAVSFAILQVADPLATALSLPDSFLSLVVGLLLLGFPVALVLAWAFEVTPEGLQKAEPAAPGEIEAIVAQPAAKRWGSGLLALAGIVALVLGSVWVGRQTVSAPDLNLGASEAHAADFSRIAVLPFDDLGGNEDDDPFLSGMHVDIHGKLMALSDLRVTALGSVRDYGASGKTPAEIAEELSVDYLLRGSVRRAGARARVNVQLTDVAAGEDIWFDEFDQEVTATNLFDIQSEIARQVARALEAKLSPRDIQQLEAGLSTEDPEALNAYYRARSAWGNTAMRTSDDILRPAGRAAPLVERAVELAPDFVEAWALGAEIWSASSLFGEEAAGRALRAVERAESLAPGSLAATRARAWYEFKVSEDLSLALSLFQTAESMAPSDVDVLSTIGELQYRLGDFAEGSRTMRQAVFLDPRNADVHANLARPLRNRSMWDAANAVLDRALAIDPSNEQAQREKAWLIAQGDSDPRRALDLMAEFGLEPRFQALFFSVIARDYDAAAKILRGALASPAEAGGIDDLIENLGWLAWVEQVRGGDVAPVRDSLASLLARDSAQIESRVTPRTRGRALLAIGREEEGFAVLEATLEDARSSEDQASLVATLWSTARSYAQFGYREEALALLDEAVGRPASDVWSMADLELEPRFDVIRDNPRFADLLARQQAYEDEQARIAEAEGPWLP